MEVSSAEISKLVIDVLCNYERFLYASRTQSLENTDVVYFLYSSFIKLINKSIHPEKRYNRIFRLKYHHILADDSVDEYLFHCLSKILSDVLDAENHYHKYIQPVVELHLKLISTLSIIAEFHNKIVLNNEKVKQEIVRYDESGKKWKSLLDADFADGKFKPVYYLPPSRILGGIAKLRKSQILTLQAITHHYDQYAPISSILNGDLLCLLVQFDEAFAEFELDFVCQVNKTSILTKESAEATMEVASLFIDTIEWAANRQLLTYSAIAECDIELMMSIPRLVVLYGCGVTENGPLSEKALLGGSCSDILAPVFENHRATLSRLRRQLGVLNELEMTCLTHLLISNSMDELPPVIVPPLQQAHSPSSVLASTNDVYFSHNVLRKASSLNLLSGDLHSLFKLIASVADQMQSTHASDFRYFMQMVYNLFKDEPEVQPMKHCLHYCDKDNMYSACNSKSSMLCGKSNTGQLHHQSVPDLKCLTNIDKAVDVLAFINTNATSIHVDSSDSASSLESLNNVSSSTFHTKSMMVNSPGTSNNNNKKSKLAQCAEHHLQSKTTDIICNQQSHEKSLLTKHTSTFIANKNVVSSLISGAQVPPVTRQVVDLNLQFRRPEWRSDSQYRACCHCQQPFTVFRRRHHCRRCGFIFCGNCWGRKLTLPALGVHTSVPVCVECEEFITSSSLCCETKQTQSNTSSSTANATTARTITS